MKHTRLVKDTVSSNEAFKAFCLAEGINPTQDGFNIWQRGREYERKKLGQVRPAVAEIVDNAQGQGYVQLTETADLDELPVGTLLFAGPKVEQHIPANFTTHRSAWRDALVKARDTAPPKTDDSDEAAYWQHELDAYDRSFERLLSGEVIRRAEDLQQDSIPM